MISPFPFLGGGNSADYLWKSGDDFSLTYSENMTPSIMFTYLGFFKLAPSLYYSL